MLKVIGFVTALIILFCAQGSYGQVILEGMGIVQGIVADTAGVPKAGARVEAFDADTTYFDFTDFRGRYTLAIPLDGQDSIIVDLRASKPGYLPVDTSEVIVFWGTITSVDFALRVSAGPIYGHMYGNSFHELLSGAIITAIGDSILSDTTEDDGYYSIAVNYPGTYDIIFVCDDYQSDTVFNYLVDYGIPDSLPMSLDRVNWHVDGIYGDDGNIGAENDALKTIQTAIDYTNTGDTVMVGVGTYTGDNNRDLDLKINATTRNWIVVKSKEGSNFTTIDCDSDINDQHRGFVLKGGMDGRTVISGFTIKGGYQIGGGIWIWENSSPTIENCRFVGNISAQFGGAIAVEDTSKPLIKFCEFDSNSAALTGGAIGIYQAYPTIENCTILNNDANVGGGVQATYALLDTTHIINCIIRGNTDLTPMSGQINQQDAYIDVSYSNIEDTLWPGLNNFDGDPWFCYAENLDFHLAANSCCLYSGQGSMFVGAYGQGCGDIGGVRGTVTRCVDGDSLFGVEIQLTSSTGESRSAITDSSGYYRILVPNTPVFADIQFSHPEPTLVDLDTTDYYVAPGDSADPLDVCLVQSGCNPYIVGNVNGDSAYNGLDISYGIRYFRGDTTAIPSDSCDCPPDSGYWYMVGDVNGDCSYNGLDITYGIAFFKGTNSAVYPCPDCPGAIESPAAISNRTPKDPRVY